MKQRIIRNKGGMSLLEVLIGMLVLAVGLLGLAPMLTVSIEGNVASRDATTAGNLAKAQIEHYESLNYVPVLPDSIVQNNLQGKFNLSTFVTDSTTNPSVPAGAYRVDVRVAWVDHQNVPRSTQYSTLILEP